MHKHSAHPDRTSAENRSVVTRANLEVAVRDASRKQAFVTPLFDLIAPRYDRFTRVFSYGMDSRWKEHLVRWCARDLALESSPVVLDVACGTGDLAIATASALPRAQVTGVDVSERMLELAQRRIGVGLRERVRFVHGDLSQLGTASASVSGVTAGYAVRNAPEPRQALGELARVLRSGGRLYVLDFFRPSQPLWRALYLGYLRTTGAAVGWLWHRAPAAYEYIAASIDRFVSHAEFSQWLAEAGFTVERVQPRLGGGVALISAKRR